VSSIVRRFRVDLARPDPYWPAQLAALRRPRSHHPGRRSTGHAGPPTDAGWEPGWQPSFADYLYLSLTNSTAYSPTDTMPLSKRAKLTMGVQSVASLITIGLLIARAIASLSA
jgi:hypothetical protein